MSYLSANCQIHLFNSKFGMLLPYMVLLTICSSLILSTSPCWLKLSVRQSQIVSCNIIWSLQFGIQRSCDRKAKSETPQVKTQFSFQWHHTPSLRREAETINVFFLFLSLTPTDTCQSTSSSQWWPAYLRWVFVPKQSVYATLLRMGIWTPVVVQPHL